MDIKIFQTGPMFVNTYVLTDEETKEAAIIDLGGFVYIIKRELDKRDYNIKFILNTHAHFDHILGEYELQQYDGNVPIYIHEADMYHINNINNELKLYNLNITVDKKLENINYLDENSELYVGNNRIKVLYTPGHSKGSVSYYIDGYVFTGDALFSRNIGRTDLYEGNYEELITSIKNKLLTLPEDTIVFPGHGPSTSIKEEKQENPYLIQPD